ncbi:MAG: hypothetical protein R3344_15655, partial [Acidobacteriota bacterium]|nr:hypothetical protein [Acidobacteriota bacterium]
DHPWFVACQFHPEYKSRPLAPHPLFREFVAASYRHRQARSSSGDTVATPRSDPTYRSHDELAADPHR